MGSGSNPFNTDSLGNSGWFPGGKIFEVRPGPEGLRKNILKYDDDIPRSGLQSSRQYDIDIPRSDPTRRIQRARGDGLSIPYQRTIRTREQFAGLHADDESSRSERSEENIQSRGNIGLSRHNTSRRYQRTFGTREQYGLSRLDTSRPYQRTFGTREQYAGLHADVESPRSDSSEENIQYRGKIDDKNPRSDRLTRSSQRSRNYGDAISMAMKNRFTNTAPPLRKNGVAISMAMKNSFTNTTPPLRKNVEKCPRSSRLEERFQARGKDQICQYHLRGRCSWGSNCRDVHCDLPYQWRYRNRQQQSWTVIENNNDGIERAFSDPTNERHTIKLSYKCSMTIDFKQMSGDDNEGGLFEIERLSTPSSVNHGNQTLRTNWLWYWKNPNGKWIKFGDLDDYGGNKAEIKSKDLEEAFVADPTGVAKFKTTGTQSYEYIVEFSEMIQRNTAYNTERELRRRPEFIIKLDFELNHLRLVRNTDNTVSKGIKAPANWSIPKGKDLLEHIVIVKLNKSDSEYRQIQSMFFQSLQNVDIKSIDRIENGDLWENYMMKKSKMLKKKNERQLGEKRVFHGTLNKNIAAICKQGFDFRLEGQASGLAYGKGCYFSTESHYSNTYTENGSDKSMFVAKILPGEYVRGNSSYSRPPYKDTSDQSSDLYDSCVDDDSKPSIFVIFDNNQIYPEYLIRYTKK